MASRLSGLDSATMVGLATAGGIYLIYNDALPSLTDVREASPDDSSVEQSRKHAAWLSVALIGGVFLLARDVNSYIISGIALVGIDYLYKHNNMIHSASGKLHVDRGGSVAPGMAGAYPLPDYTADDENVA
jgi:hypothetical protein